MPGRPANGELWVGLGTVLFAGIVAWQVALIPSEATYARVGPQAIPWLVAGLLALFGAALAVQSLLGRARGEGADGDTGHGAIDRAGIAWMILGLALNVALIEAAGFIFASTLLFVCTARAFGSRSLARDAAVGFALAFIAYIGFDRVLGYKIGSGWIEMWL